MKSFFSGQLLKKLVLSCHTYCVYGDYGVTVNTAVCGSADSGSIPDSRP